MHNLARTEAAQRAGLLAVDRYDVGLDLTGGGDTFRSTSTVRFGCREPGAATFVEILAPTVRGVVLNGTALDPAAILDGDRLRLDGLQAGNVLKVTADCAYSRSGEGLHRFVDPADGETYLYSMTFLYDAHRVFACFDQPDLKAVFAFSVMAPPEWECISNGAVASRDGGRWNFLDTPRMSTYLTAVCAGPYVAVRDRWENVDLGLHCRRSLASHLDAAEIFEVTKQSFVYYTEAFGIPYAFGKYDQIFLPEFNAGAMENPGAVTLRDEFLFRSRVTEPERELRAYVVAHEMAHMWFGDLVTMRWWDDLWLNESFATYMGEAALVAVTRFTQAWTSFTVGGKADSYRADQLPSTHPVSTAVPDTDAALLNFDGISYGKGAAALRQLVAWVGEEAFLRGVRVYMARHAYGNTGLADLLGALEAESGRDLAAWAEAWLRTPGVSTLRPLVEVAADGTYTAVEVHQQAPAGFPVLRPHRVVLGLYDDGPNGLTRRDRLELDLEGAVTPVPELAGRAAPALLLVNDDDLTFAKIRFDERSLRTVLDRLGTLQSPLARTLCWAAAWDMTRDGELPPTQFLGLVLRALPAEDDVQLVEAVLRQAGTALDRYVTAKSRDVLGIELSQLCRSRLATAPPGGDLQVAYARGWVGTAGAEDAAGLSGLLAGEDVPAGLAVDAELRWQVLIRLAVLGDARPEDIDAELARDRTASGEQAAATARAARPTVEAKDAAWTALTQDSTLSNRAVTSTAAGFWQPTQLDLCRPYVERYFGMLDDVWRTRNPEIAHQLTARLYPGLYVEADTLARTEAHLRHGDPPPGLRRILLEQSDEVARALRARAAGGPDTALSGGTLE